MYTSNKSENHDNEGCSVSPQRTRKGTSPICFGLVTFRFHSGWAWKDIMCVAFWILDVSMTPTNIFEVWPHHSTPNNSRKLPNHSSKTYLGQSGHFWKSAFLETSGKARAKSSWRSVLNVLEHLENWISTFQTNMKWKFLKVINNICEKTWYVFESLN